MKARQKRRERIFYIRQAKTREPPSVFAVAFAVASSWLNPLGEEENMNRLPTVSSSFTPNYAGMSSDITGKIVQMVKHRQACDMEDLLEACPSYTWNQVFLEVDRLSRTGELRLFSKRAGKYTVTLPAA